MSRPAAANDSPLSQSGANRRPVELAWYRMGLRFECQSGCGMCCSGTGVVRVGIEEIDAMAVELGLTRAEFARAYVTGFGEGLALRDRGPHGDCILLGPQRECRAYRARPIQCRTWPFWPSNLTRQQAWKESAERCPGINRGRLFSLTEIERTAELIRSEAMLSPHCPSVVAASVAGYPGYQRLEPASDQAVPATPVKDATGLDASPEFA